MERQQAPGKSTREGISLFELMDMFPDEDSAVKWLEAQRWGDEEKPCPHCGSLRTKDVPKKKPMPYHCGDCRKFFSVRTGTVMAESRLPLRKWVFAMYLWATSLKGVSSMKLHRDLKITQKSAWFMAHRLREAWESNGGMFSRPIEADETFIGGKEKNKHSSKKLRAGRGGVGKAIVAGIKDRETNQVKAKVVTDTKAKTLQGFVNENVSSDSMKYTDDATAYIGMKNHEVVKHSVGEYVVGMAHTNGIESFWSMLKRAYHGTYHKISPKHLQRYVDEFSTRHNCRQLNTIDQMADIFKGGFGKRLTYKALING